MRKRERGSVIVEASIVFPVMFLVIIFMLFLGNAYLQKCRVQEIVTKAAIDGAALCADPILKDVKDGTIPDANSIEIEPYRYFMGNASSATAPVKEELTNDFKKIDSGLFSGMTPSDGSIDVKFNNDFIRSSFKAEIDYKIKMPIRLLGQKDNIMINYSALAEVPVSDSDEFIRNVDMVEDYAQRMGITDKFNEVLEKAKSFGSNYTNKKSSNK